MCAEHLQEHSEHGYHCLVTRKKDFTIALLEILKIFGQDPVAKNLKRKYTTHIYQIIA